jgi:hypothetical protein
MDLVGFGSDGVHTALSMGTGFATEKVASSAFGSNRGWNVDNYIRTTADLNNDGKADLVGFGAASVGVALSTAQPPPVCPPPAGQCSGFPVANDVRFLDSLVAHGVSGCTVAATLCTGSTSLRAENTIFYAACPSDPNGPLRTMPGLLSDQSPNFHYYLPVIADTFKGSCLPPAPAGMVYVMWDQSKIATSARKHNKPRCESGCLCPPDMCSSGPNDQ